MSCAPVADRLRALCERLAAEGATPAALDDARALGADVKELEVELAALRDLTVATSRLAEQVGAMAALDHELRQPALAIPAERGTGLGLVICRELARAMDGRGELCDDDERPAGEPWPWPPRTVFRVVLPAAPDGGRPGGERAS